MKRLMQLMVLSAICLNALVLSAKSEMEIQDEIIQDIWERRGADDDHGHEEEHDDHEEEHDDHEEEHHGHNKTLGSQHWDRISIYPNEMQYPKPFLFEGYIYLFGDSFNKEFDTDDHFDYIWKLDPENLKWEKVSTTGDVPTRRSQYCVSVHDGKAYMFGGHTPAFTNQVYMLDLKNMKWTLVETSGENKPSVRYYCSCFFYKDEFYVYGGLSIFFSLDLWKLKIGNVWERIRFSDGEAVLRRTATEAVPYKDGFLLFGGCNDHHECDRILHYFNITTMKWSDFELPQDTSGLPNGVADASYSLIEDRLYVFGGAETFDTPEPTANLLVIPLEGSDSTIHNLTVISANSHKKRGGDHPLWPSARSRHGSVVHENKIYIIGGTNGCSMNDVWVYDTENSAWVDSTSNKYPTGRTGAKMVQISTNETLLIGGASCPPSHENTFDLWLFDSSLFGWKYIGHAPMDSDYEQKNCTPSLNPVVATRVDQKVFILFSYENCTIKGAIYNHVNHSIENWNIGPNHTNALFLRYNGVDNTFTMVTLCDSEDCQRDHNENVHIVHLEHKSDKERNILFASRYNSASNMEAPVDVEESCFTFSRGKNDIHEHRRRAKRADDGKSDSHDHEEDEIDHFLTDFKIELKCLNQSNQIYYSSSEYVPQYGKPSLFNYINLFAFGGAFANGETSRELIIHSRDEHSPIKIGDGPNKIPTTMHGASASNPMVGSVYYFGGAEYEHGTVPTFSNSIYRLDMTKLWCRENMRVEDESGMFSDGSEDFDLIPGSECSWIFKGPKYFQFAEIDLGAAQLVLTANECGDEILIDDVERGHKVSISEETINKTIFIPAVQFVINMTLHISGKPGAGFLANFKACGRGFKFINQACFCDQSTSFVTYLGDCIKNVSDFRISEEQKHETGYGRIVQISSSPPPLLFPATAVVNNKTLLIGGLLSGSENQASIFNSLENIYVVDGLYTWSLQRAIGEIPPPRFSACAVTIEKYVILIGGKTSDGAIYSLDTTLYQWKRVLSTPIERHHHSCAFDGKDIYVYGGLQMNGRHPEHTMVRLSATKWTQQGFGYYKDLKHVGNRSGAILTYYEGHLFLFGGAEVADDKTIYSYNIERDTWNFMELGLRTGCVSCDDFKGQCSFGRSFAAYALNENELHIIGGIHQGRVLADILIIQLKNVSAYLLFQENFGLRNPALPLQSPPPKYGAGFSKRGSRLEIYGGGFLSNNYGSDFWSWDLEQEVWAESSVEHIPIHRHSSSLAKKGDNKILMFGGATYYVNELMLNDLWEFDTRTGSWVRLIKESNSISTPAPRASAGFTFHNNIVYIVGGRFSPYGRSDELLWSCNITGYRLEWVGTIIGHSLSRNQRPLGRVGTTPVFINKQFFIWGGQLSFQLDGFESYSSIFRLSTTDAGINYGQSPTSEPETREYFQFSSRNDSQLLIYGGQSHSGIPLDDLWRLDIYNDSLSWTQIQYSGHGPKLFRGVLASDADFTLLHGGINSGNSSLVWMLIEGKSYQMHQLKFSSSNFLSSMIRDHSGLLMGNEFIFFGGTDGFMTTNQVFSYIPATCIGSPGEAVILEKSSFDSIKIIDLDIYTPGGRCVWRIENASHLYVSRMQLGQGHRLTSEPLISDSTKNSATGNLNVISLQHGQSIDGSTGFLLVLDSTSSEISARPCQNCEGFKIVVANCPENSKLENGMCVCNAEYHKEGDSTCIKHEESPIGLALGTAFGSLFVVLGAIGFIYRKRLLSRLKHTEDKLYAQIRPKDITLGPLLGSGSFGEVFKGVYRGTEVAIKKINQYQLKKETLEAFFAEINVMTDLRHPNIVLYMGASMDHNNTFIVCELMQMGSLYDVIHNHELHISPSRKINLLLDAAKGMQYLHTSDPPILHRDLKSPNLLLDEKWHLKVSDFGMTAIQGSTKDDLGSLLWLAPEVINGEQYTAASDVYSFGIICWEVIARDEPYKGIASPLAVITQISLIGLRPQIPPDTSAELRLLIEAYWNQDPSLRPTFSEIVSTLSQMRSSTTRSDQMDEENQQPFPSGDFSVVAMCVESCQVLWEHVPDAMLQAILVLSSITKECAIEFSGYLDDHEPEKPLAVFQNEIDALRFAVSVQERLNQHPWSEAILHDICCQEAANGSLRGLRCKMGLGYGRVTVTKATDARRYHFRGAVVSRTKKLRKLAHGGQILFYEEFFQKIDRLEEKINFAEVSSLDWSGETIEGKSYFYQAVPITLKERRKHFDQLQRTSEYDRTNMSSISRDSESKSDLFIGSADAIPGTSDEKKRIKKEPRIFPSDNGDRSHSYRDLDESSGEWEISWSDLQLTTKVLGSGSFGTVKVGRYKGLEVAVKVMTHQTKGNDYYLTFISEACMMRQAKHKNILSLIGVCCRSSHLAIVTELVEMGSLRSVLGDQTRRLLKEQKYRIIQGVIEAMAYLHSKDPPMLHRDLKTSNILIDQNFNPKIRDFGFARMKAFNKTMTKCGTTCYQAPEVLDGQRYSEKADVYSFSIVLWEIDSRRIPFSHMDIVAVPFAVIKGSRPEFTAASDPKIAALASSCWNPLPDARPAFVDMPRFD